MPDEEYDHRADDGAEAACAPVRAIPPDGLPDQRRDERAGDAKECRENKARRVVRSGRQEARAKRPWWGRLAGKASTIATKADGAENREQLARTKKN